MSSPINPFLREANFINGEWVPANSGETMPVNNPADGAKLGVVPFSGVLETRGAIKAAHSAFGGWQKTTALERAQLLRRLHDAIMDNQEALATLLTLEQGKPLTEARGEIASGAAYILWFAEEARRIYGDVVPSPWADKRILVTKEPVGVVGAITPWNFPSSMLARKLGPALAAGCTAVVKPATQTPFSALAWGVLLEEVGLPSGVVNIVTGDAAAIGDELCTSPLVRKITFTGSTGIGKMLIAKAASTVKRVSMELGGNAPFIVFDDADLDRAVAGAFATKFRNSGQTCICTNRFFVQSGIHDAFVERFATAVKALTLGSGLDPASNQGPLIDSRAVSKTEEFVTDAREKGGIVVTGGQRHSLGGNFYEPTVISGAKPDMMFMRDEIFGPIAPVFRFEEEQEVIELANATDYGLACYVYTTNLGRAVRVMEGLKYGMVGINEGLIAAPEVPFGGVKHSGLGREGGRQGIEDYVETKYVCVGGFCR
ncbi:NAD-dependent succinate-semialdehyde dehydrogenase [Ensifer adhaerens]|uniref:NAD-dependent succinate-semialdehyde dehydrogenase n=1 Tax=Ensifer adhaerens TaxID=106592 RepID=UPI000FD6F649|nr:NAD-dependent succinate-semialdehyde dehydrogenase [Ensifer adhaerens]MDF8357550.1 NAD-dependent succinate-semialdehyde dehydrogenase [Ensifer adhaerens]THA61018.1 NAD-dependent succinate-semialdehyde dehydrogenase [Ensifer adhaerens]